MFLKSATELFEFIFSKPILMVAAQLLAITSHLAAKLRFVDYGSIFELNSSVNRSVEYHG